MLIAELHIPTTLGQYKIRFEAGRSIIFVGANGAGKTRLGVYIESLIDQGKSHRVAAHRSLVFSDKITSISLDRALNALQTGYMEKGVSRYAGRWQQSPATTLLSDYDFVLQALFAEQGRIAVQHLENHRQNQSASPPPTLLSQLQRIWERLLPHRKLIMLELSILVRPVAQNVVPQEDYPGSQMSDGERVIFYLLGQCLLAPKNSLIIIDEPELHVHKAVVGKLWDAVEAERPDCSFVHITHDLDFVTARPTASKHVVRSYSPPGNWEIEQLPAGTGLPDRVVSELVGARQPVLFVEGDRASVDATIYRCVYSDFLVEPIGTCNAVIHAVSSFRNNQTLHRIGNVRGCVDADAREAAEIAQLISQDVYVLPVAEIENVLLIPAVFMELAKALSFPDSDAATRLDELTTDVLAKATAEINEASVRYASRRLDAELKRLAPNARTIGDLTTRYSLAVASVDPTRMAIDYQNKLQDFISSRDLKGVISLFDNKGLLTIGARHLGMKGRDNLVEYAGRVLIGSNGQALLAALRAELPTIPI